MEQYVDTAVALTGFGKFNIKVMIVCALIYLNNAASISHISLILPSAACDFDLSTTDKGRLTAAPMLGMVVSAYFWGCLANLLGRRKALLIALFAHATFEAVSSIIPNYWGFLLFKFFTGFAINGQSTVVFTYLGEFQPERVREKMLSWMEMAWSLGLIILPLIGWGILTLNVSYVSDKFFFHSWNLFIIVCSLSPFCIGLWLLSFPETPKYLAESGNNRQLAKTLHIMHTENTGKSYDHYLEMLSKNGCDHLYVRLQNPQLYAATQRRPSTVIRTEELIVNTFKETITLFKPPLLSTTANICSLMFCLGFSCYTLMLWFPELFQRFVQFETNFPGETASVCSVSEQKIAINETIVLCPTKLSRDVYVHTIIIGVACLPSSAVLPLFVDKLGYKFYLVVSSLIASVVAFGLLFVNSSVQNLILSCIFEACTSAAISIVYCLNVDLFPTNSRAITAALCVFFARSGALVGSSLCGILIDSYCFALIIVIATELLACAILAYLLPVRKRSKRVLPADSNLEQNSET